MIKRNFDLNYGREIIFQWIDDYTKKFDKNNKKFKILDIGCGWGNDLTALFEISKNIELYGIEIEDEKIAACQPKNIMIFKLNCEKIEFPLMKIFLI